MYPVTWQSSPDPPAGSRYGCRVELSNGGSRIRGTKCGALGALLGFALAGCAHEREVVRLGPGAAVPVTVKRTCFIRVDDRGIRISADGQDFDEKSRVPSSFQLGVWMTPEASGALSA
jgi:hypothetical protein